MKNPHFDSLEFSLGLYGQTPQELCFKAKNAKQALQWQKLLRSRLTRLMGGFPASKVPLQARVLASKNMGSYTKETVLFETQAHLTAYGYFLKPKGFRSPGPSVVCLPGHGRGVDSIVGQDEHGRYRAFGQWGEYQADFALQCVSQGLAVFALEQLGFGYRRDPAAMGRGPAGSSCQPASGSALLLGQTMMAWRVYDLIRTVDYLLTRPEVDKKRIGVMGISGGGATALFGAALDTRIRLAMVSGYFNTFRDSIFSLSHCMDNYVPGLLRVAEMPDIAGLIAPRALFVESGSKDDIFPVAATQAAYKQTKKIFQRLGADSRLGMELFPEEHSFWGKQSFPFIKKNL